MKSDSYFIRSITQSVNINNLHDCKYLERLQKHFEKLKNDFEKENIHVRTLRFIIEDNFHYERHEPFLFLKKIDHLSRISKSIGVRWFNLAFDLTQKGEKDIISICKLCYEVIRKHKNLFINLIVANKGIINPFAALIAAQTIINISKLSFNGFDNFRVGVSLEPKENTPFFPFSYSRHNNCYSIAMETSMLFHKIIYKNKNQSLTKIRTHLIKEQGNFSKLIDSIVENYSKSSNFQYMGQDISLAPYPDSEISVVNILQMLGLDNIGSSGTIFLTSYLTDIIKEIIIKYNIKNTGFNGVMYSLLEDHLMCEANNKKLLSIDSLIAYSTMCGCGLDMVPVPGNILDTELASIILDIAAIANRLRKPLGVRILPIPNGDTNEYSEFDTDFITNTRIINIKNNSCSTRVFNSAYYIYCINNY